MMCGGLQRPAIGARQQPRDIVVLQPLGRRGGLLPAGLGQRRVADAGVDPGAVEMALNSDSPWRTRIMARRPGATAGALPAGGSPGPGSTIS